MSLDQTFIACSVNQSLIEPTICLTSNFDRPTNNSTEMVNENDNNNQFLTFFVSFWSTLFICTWKCMTPHSYLCYCFQQVFYTWQKKNSEQTECNTIIYLPNSRTISLKTSWCQQKRKFILQIISSEWSNFIPKFVAPLSYFRRLIIYSDDRSPFKPWIVAHFILNISNVLHMRNVCVCVHIFCWL